MNNEMAKVWIFLFSVTIFLACFFNLFWLLSSALLLIVGFIKMA